MRAAFLWLAITAILYAGSPTWAAEVRAMTMTSLAAGVELPATLFVPEGAGPFPAVVVARDCSGLGPRSSGAPRRWAEELVAQGYVVLIADSFSRRGLPNGVCTAPNNEGSRANGFVRAQDSYGAFAALRGLPFVDAGRVGLMGGSHGGWTTLASLAEFQTADIALAQAKRRGFRAAIALYPNCSSRFGSWIVTREHGAWGAITGYSGTYRALAPLLILIGEIDDWTPAEPCRRLAETSRAAGYDVAIVVYPDAHHSFDNTAPKRYAAERNNANAPNGKGATTGGNAAAWADAKAQVATFFGKHLKAPREN